MKSLLSVFLVVSLFSGMTAYAQMSGEKSKRPSPPATASGMVGSVKVDINYSVPSVKGRKIYGDLEPYGSVWRAGANEATTISFDKNVTINGKPLAKGKYAFFILLNSEDKWTLIFNKNTTQWGTEHDSNAAQDVLKVPVTVRAIPSVEKLKYNVTADGVTLDWSTREVHFVVVGK